MAEKPRQAVPLKCGHCSRTMSTPIVCDFCESLNAPPATTDHFTLLGLPRQFAVDQRELQRRYVALNRHAHPDFHARESDEVQELSLHLATSLNQAYRTLADPARRAAYLLELLGGKSSCGDKTVPEDFLDTVMMMQEELADAKASADAAELRRLRDVLGTQQEGLLKRVAGLFEQYEQAVGCEAIRQDLLGEIRRQLNALAYVKKLLSQAQYARNDTAPKGTAP